MVDTVPQHQSIMKISDSAEYVVLKLCFEEFIVSKLRTSEYIYRVEFEFSIKD